MMMNDDHTIQEYWLWKKLNILSMQPNMQTLDTAEWPFFALAVVCWDHLISATWLVHAELKTTRSTAAIPVARQGSFG